MVSRHPNIWNWLQFFAVGLMILGAFAPLPQPFGKLLLPLGAVLLLAYHGAIEWEERRKRQADRSSSAA